MGRRQFKEGQKVTWRGTTYDFAYYSATPGKCVLYEEGECNMQDSIAVDTDEVDAPQPPPVGEQRSDG